MSQAKSYKQLGPGILLVEWVDQEIDQVLSEVLALQKSIEELSFSGFKETWTTYKSLAIAFDPGKIEFAHLVELVKKIEPNPTEQDRTLWRIPACYEAPFNRDLGRLSESLKLETREIVSIHTSPTYTVAFIGFLPGFLYLAGLDGRLHYPRKPTPDRAVPKGSVAIGGTQTGIYPSESPGGWHIIGNCPLDTFDAQEHPPCFLESGDRVKFEAVDVETHQRILEEVRSGEFDYYNLLDNGEN